jgi:hypothetical protein
MFQGQSDTLLGSESTKGINISYAAMPSVVLLSPSFFLLAVLSSLTFLIDQMAESIRKMAEVFSMAS